MRIAQLSDLHLAPSPLYSGVDPWQALSQALVRVAGLRPCPDLLLLTGDLANDGGVSSYRQLKEALLKAGRPFAVLPGNHDDRQALRAVFSEQAWSHDTLACQRVDCGELSLLLLDTLIPGQDGGEITAAHLTWLDGCCPPQGRVVLGLHHPPFPVGIAGMDAIGCAGGKLLADWLEDHPQVEALLCGHVHRPVTTLFAGRLAMTAPATVHQIALQDGPLAWTSEAGGLLVHDCFTGEPLRSHYLPLTAATVVRYAD